MLKYLKIWEASRSDQDPSRYLSSEACAHRLQNVIPYHAALRVLGNSAEGRPIYCVNLGRGPLKLLFWTQMHGNEPTATRAMLDFFNYLSSSDGRTWFDAFADKISICVIPMLNPDGAEQFTRRNAAGVDMNRDARALQTQEMRLFFNLVEEFAPDWAFNLHDQRNIYNVSGTGSPATISLLAPAADATVTLTPGRYEVMQLAGALHREMNEVIPGGIGRYSDEFYPTATGDNLQKSGIKTLLIESGGAIDDPMRHKARFLNFASYIRICEILANREYSKVSVQDYFSIPPNTERMLDIKLTDVLLPGKVLADVGIIMEEILTDGFLKPKYTVAEIGDLQDWFAYKTIDYERREAVFWIGMEYDA
jgi:hypothetical protein